MKSKKYVLPLGLAAVVLIVSGLTAGLAGGDPEDTRAQVNANSNAPEAAQRAFGVFRQAQRSSDVTPRLDSGVTSSRQLSVNGPGKLFAQTKSDGEICITYLGAEYGGTGCAPSSSAASPDRPLMITLPGEDGTVVVAGLLRDGPDLVEVNTGARTSTEGAVVENGFVVQVGEPRSISWLVEGERYSRDLAALQQAPPG